MRQSYTIFGVDYGKDDMTIISVMDKGEFTHLYRTIDDWFRVNGERHLERAIAYASAGYPDRFYEGSMRKALRNFKIANDFKMPHYLASSIELMGKMICDNIMNGNTNVSNVRPRSRSD